METLWVIINVLVLILLVGILYWMQRKHISFTKRVFAGLGLGVLFGVALRLIYTSTSDVVVKSTDWFNLIGYGYVRSAQMMVIPLIMVSIISAIMKLKGGKNLGKMSGLIITVSLLTTAVAAAVGITTALAFDLSAVNIQGGLRRSGRVHSLQERLGDVEGRTLPQRDPGFHSEQSVCRHDGARRTSTIAVVIFSAFIGIAVLGLDRKTRSRRKRSAI